ncbi:cobalt-precorrin-6A reductase [Burkholderia oklahomensis EO147]|nr:cobalt-precorrin-6A reductase [Burkholderia oklahomensis EO147]KUY68717.1 cobalt-precorrin-6A reductase [Burkholderia oklahomensis EO147]
MRRVHFTRCDERRAQRDCVGARRPDGDCTRTIRRTNRRAARESRYAQWPRHPANANVRFAEAMRPPIRTARGA